MTIHHIQVQLSGMVICWCGAHKMFTPESAAAEAEAHSVRLHHKKGAALDIEQEDGSVKHTGWCGDRACKIHVSIPKSNRLVTSMEEDDPRCPHCGYHVSDHDDPEVTCRG